MSALAPRLLPLGHLLVFSPLGLSFVDDFSGADAIGYITPTLEVEKAPGSNTWEPTGVRGLFTPGRKLAYPNLGRRGKVSPQAPKQRHRVTLATQYYNPFYAEAQYLPAQTPTADGIVFVVTPYDDNSDFSALTPTMVALPMLPRANYPFGGNAAFLNGRVVGVSGTPIAALVTAEERYDDTATNTRQTRQLSDAGGVFRMPLRWGFTGAAATVTARDLASNKSASISVNYPYVLSSPQTITIPNL